MKSPLYVIMVTIALLVTLTLPALSSKSVISGGRAGGRQISHEQVARRGANVVCQSGYRMRRLSGPSAAVAICAKRPSTRDRLVRRAFGRRLLQQGCIVLAQGCRRAGQRVQQLPGLLKAGLGLLRVASVQQDLSPVEE